MSKFKKIVSSKMTQVIQLNAPYKKLDIGGGYAVMIDSKHLIR